MLFSNLTLWINALKIVNLGASLWDNSLSNLGGIPSALKKGSTSYNNLKTPAIDISNDAISG